MPRLLSAFALLAFALPLFAQEPKKDEEAVKKQKTTATDNLKTLKIAKPTLVETDALLVYADMTEEKLKPIAELAQKAHDRAVKDLKFGEKDRMWAGKLTVYVLADRPTEYTKFVKLVEQRTGRLDSDEMQTHSTKGPYVAVTTAPGSKTAEADLRAEATTAVVAALLDQKAGAALPSWLHVGVGKAVSYRTEGNAKALEAHKAKVKGLLRTTAFKTGDVWGDTKPKEYDTLAVSLAEYMLYGADAETVGKFLGGFRATEERRDPSVMTAMEAAGWKAADLEAAWAKWARTGK